MIFQEKKKNSRGLTTDEYGSTNSFVTDKTIFDKLVKRRFNADATELLSDVTHTCTQHACIHTHAHREDQKIQWRNMVT